MNWSRFKVPAAVLIAVLGMFYLFCVHYTEPNQVAIVRNLLTGELYCDTQAGFNITAPWVSVARIDLRPMRVCISTAGRAINCRLVQFNPSAYQEFVAVEGFRYYWWANRISFNGGYDEEYRGMRDIMRGHAYGSKQYSFITVLEEYSE